MITPQFGRIEPEDVREPDGLAHARAVAAMANWCWRVDVDGKFIMACWVVDEPWASIRMRAGWLQMCFGTAADSISARRWGRPALRYFMRCRDRIGYTHLRAWVASDAARDLRFAQFCGFAYDAGPATAFLPDGRDATLMLWRA